MFVSDVLVVWIDERMCFPPSVGISMAPKRRPREGVAEQATRQEVGDALPPQQTQPLPQDAHSGIVPPPPPPPQVAQGLDMTRFLEGMAQFVAQHRDAPVPQGGTGRTAAALEADTLRTRARSAEVQTQVVPSQPHQQQGSVQTTPRTATSYVSTSTGTTAKSGSRRKFRRDRRQVEQRQQSTLSVFCLLYARCVTVYPFLLCYLGVGATPSRRLACGCPPLVSQDVECDSILSDENASSQQGSKSSSEESPNSQGTNKGSGSQHVQERLSNPSPKTSGNEVVPSEESEEDNYGQLLVEEENVSSKHNEEEDNEDEINENGSEEQTPDVEQEEEESEHSDYDSDDEEALYTPSRAKRMSIGNKSLLHPRIINDHDEGISVAGSKVQKISRFHMYDLDHIVKIMKLNLGPQENTNAVMELEQAHLAREEHQGQDHDLPEENLLEESPPIPSPSFVPTYDVPEVDPPHISPPHIPYSEYAPSVHDIPSSSTPTASIPPTLITFLEEQFASVHQSLNLLNTKMDEQASNFDSRLEMSEQHLQANNMFCNVWVTSGCGISAVCLPADVATTERIATSEEASPQSDATLSRPGWPSR
ncbi:hypothetical protein Taro_013907 [Colocasia esculenta]|uniref:Uncharacterized protein n=1 Tax=Colocasia esculenta TaxID=4460 RepID=A0A843UD11_COLES|nr:hypothetical protein [Colocasia esculenta]